MTTRTTETFNPFRMAAEAFQTTMETGLKFQKDAIDMMMEATRQGDGFEDVRRRWETFAADSVDVFRKNAEQSQKLVDDTCRSGKDFLRKTFEQFGKTEGNGRDVFKQGQEFFQDAFDTLQTATETITKANAQMVENFSALLSKTTGASEKKPVAK